MARSAVSGYSRLPSPPARTMPSTCGSFPHDSNLSARSHGGQAFALLDLATVRQGIWRLPQSAFGTTPAAQRDGTTTVVRHAGGDDDAGVSARGLRRRRRARHRTRRAVAPPVRGRRALHGRAARRGVRRTSPTPRSRAPTPALSTLSADLVMANAAGEATVVHSHTWYTGHGRAPGGAAVRHPARADRALAGADAAVEGRTARRRLPGVVVGGTHRGGGRRRGDRGQLGHARRRAAHLSGAGSQPGARGAQRDRHRGLVSGHARRRRVGARPNSASTRRGRSWRSSGGSPGRRASRTWSPRRTSSRPTCSWCCAPARRTPRRSPPR